MRRFWVPIAMTLGVAAVSMFAGCDLPQGMQSSLLPDYITKVSVPMFENETNVPQLDSDVTQVVRRKLTEDGRLQVVHPDQNPQSELSGAVIHWEKEPLVIDPGTKRVYKWRVRIQLRATFTDLVSKHVLWKEPFNQMVIPFETFYEYYAIDNPDGKTPETDEQARTAVIGLIGDKLVARCFQ